MSRTRSIGKLLAALLLVTVMNVQGGQCAEAWRAEFDEACQKTTEAMTLSPAELEALIEKCSRLEKMMEGQDETVRKVYLKRLQMCKNMYIFARDAKKENVQ